MNTLEKTNTASILKQYNLDFEVFPLPMMAIDEKNNLEIESNLIANCRMLNGVPKILGTVGKNYQLLQNKDALKVFDPIFENGLATIENAGSFHHGSKVFIEAKLSIDDMEVLPGDIVSPYILLANSCDGSLSVHFGFTPKRVACLNSLMEACKGDKLAKVRHKANIVHNLERIREMMDFVNQKFILSVEQYKELTKIAVNAEQFKQYVKDVFSQDPDTETDRKSRVIDDLEKLFESSPGSDIPGVRGTAWAAYNAVNYFIGNQRGNVSTTPDKRKDSLMFGDGFRINKKALTSAMALR